MLTEQAEAATCESTQREHGDMDMNEIETCEGPSDLSSNIRNGAQMAARAAAAAMGVKARKGENLNMAAVGALLVASGGLSVLANLVSSETDWDAPVTADQMLFAALLTYYAAPREDGDGGVICLDPSVVYDALVGFEKITGRRPDYTLIPMMAKVAREVGENPEKVAAYRAVRAKSTAGHERRGLPLN
jgi:hypothetical protein